MDESPGLASRSQTTPAFGKADLSNCEREQIHLAGSIQPHGALLVVREPDLVVVQTSANAARFLNLGDSILERPLDRLPGDLSARIRPHLDNPLHADSGGGALQRSAIRPPRSMVSCTGHRAAGW